MALPDIKKHNTDPAYIQKVVDDCRERHGFRSYDQVAEAVGVSLSGLKFWRGAGMYSPIPYAYQFALEQLAYGKE